jgi:hypothetical protein
MFKKKKKKSPKETGVVHFTIRYPRDVQIKDVIKFTNKLVRPHLVREIFEGNPSYFILMLDSWEVTTESYPEKITKDNFHNYFSPFPSSASVFVTAIGGNKLEAACNKRGWDFSLYDHYYLITEAEIRDLGDAGLVAFNWYDAVEGCKECGITHRLTLGGVCSACNTEDKHFAEKIKDVIMQFEEVKRAACFKDNDDEEVTKC